MKPEYFTDLDAVWSSVWEGFDRALQQRKHPWKTPALSSINPERGPQVRTVVLREVSATAGELFFHSDRRAGKLSDIASDPRVSCLFWSPKSSVQVRVSGHVHLHLDDALADAHWRKTSAHSLGIYSLPLAPAQSLELPHAPWIDESQDGRSQFCVLRLAVQSLDWLFLHRDGHQRAYFERVDGQWNATWSSP